MTVSACAMYYLDLDPKSTRDSIQPRTDFVTRESLFFVFIHIENSDQEHAFHMLTLHDFGRTRLGSMCSGNAVHGHVRSHGLDACYALLVSICVAPKTVELFRTMEKKSCVLR